MTGLYYLLKTQQVNTKELMNVFNVSKQIVTMWARGDRKIPIERLEVMSKMLNLPCEFFGEQINDDLLIDYYQNKIKNETGKKVTIILQ